MRKVSLPLLELAEAESFSVESVTTLSLDAPSRVDAFRHDVKTPGPISACSRIRSRQHLPSMRGLRAFKMSNEKAVL